MNPFEYTIGSNLREIPNDPEAFIRGISDLEAELENNKDPRDRAARLSRLGVLKRVIGDPQQSMVYLREAERLLAGIENHTLVFVNSIRIAQTFQFLGQYAAADAIYEQLDRLPQHPEVGPMMDFFHQHRGKNHFEQGRMQAAKAEIERALELRKSKGDPELIASSELALQIIKKTN